MLPGLNKLRELSADPGHAGIRVDPVFVMGLSGIRDNPAWLACNAKTLNAVLTPPPVLVTVSANGDVKGIRELPVRSRFQIEYAGIVSIQGAVRP